MTELRPYQQRDADAILAKLAPGKGVLYQLATGGGKTQIFTHIVAKLGDHRACILVHRRELLRQAAAKLEAVGVRAGIVAAGSPMDLRDRVHVASIDTLSRRIDRLRCWISSLDLVVVDEAHHIGGAATWSAVVSAADRACILGCTATPWRLDGKPLAPFFHDLHQGPSISELTADGYLCPAVIHAPPGGIDLKSVKRTAGDYNKGELAALMDRHEVTMQAVHHYAHFAAGLPTIAFCASVDHAKHAAEQFSAVGWRARSIDGSISPQERDQVFADLASGNIQILTSCELISEGVDVPVVGAAIMLRPTMSTGLHLQQCGRVLRPHRLKKHAVIIDCAKNAMAHGLPESERKWTLAAGLMRPPIGPAVVRCGKRGCWRVCAVGTAVCPSCGTRLASKATAQQAEIPQFIGGIPIDRIMAMKGFDLARMPFSDRDLRAIANVKGYRPGWVYWAKETRAGGFGRRSSSSSRGRWR